MLELRTDLAVTLLHSKSNRLNHEVSSKRKILTSLGIYAARGNFTDTVKSAKSSSNSLLPVQSSLKGSQPPFLFSSASATLNYLNSLEDPRKNGRVNCRTISLIRTPYRGTFARMNYAKINAPQREKKVAAFKKLRSKEAGSPLTLAAVI